MKRTFFNVGQGLFAVEEFNYVEDKIFTMVYDCGTLTGSVDKKKFNTFFNKIRDTGIDILFMSHLHEDHISSISDLLNNKNSKETKIYLPGLTKNEVIFESIFEFLNDNLDDTNLLESKIKYKLEFLEREDVYPIKKSEEESNEDKLKIEIDNNANPNYSKKWCFMPFFRVNQNVDLLLDDLCEEFSNFFTKTLDVEKLLDFIRKDFSINKAKIREIYEKHFSKNLNLYSMIVYSGPVNSNDFYFSYPTKRYSTLEKVACLYTGDFSFKKRSLKIIKNYYGPLYDYIGVFQSPHHGSKYNHIIDLYNSESFAIICHGEGGNHPHDCVVVELEDKGMNIVAVTEETEAYSQYIRKKIRLSGIK